MRGVVLSVVLLSAGPALAAPAPFAKTQRRAAELDKIQGQWLWHNSAGGSGRALVVGDKLRWQAANPDGLVATLSLRPATSPKSIDLTPLGISSRVQQGIYRLGSDGFTVHVAWVGESRPTSFELKRKDEVVVYVFRRLR